MSEVEQADLTALTVQLLSAYVSNNTVPSEQLASLIETTRSALGGKTEPTPEPAPEFPPAVTVRKSLGSKEHILSMIDGKPYKMLKRHLKEHGLTPAEYRERYGLSKTYPMVAPAYSEARREVAHRLGLGQRGAARRAELAAEAAKAEVPVEAIAPAPTKAPRVVKPKVAPKPAKAKAATTKAPLTEAPVEAAPSVETPAPALRASKPKAAAKSATPKPATAKRTRAKAAPVEGAPVVEAPAAETPSEAPAPKARARKPKAKAAAPKRAPKAPAAEAAPAEVVEAKPKRARKPKAAETAA